jgi:hypothetical protein
MNGKKLTLGLAISITLILIALFAYKNTPTLTAHSLPWANEVSVDTVRDSWGTWKTHYSDRNPAITHAAFMLAVKNGEYKTLSINEFLALKVENQRLERYLHAKTAEEAYPPEDRPRYGDDISSVNYLLQTTTSISPILVARVHHHNLIDYIKLDGAHRLIAATIKKSPIKVLFVDL